MRNSREPQFIKTLGFLQDSSLGGCSGGGAVHGYEYITSFKNLLEVWEVFSRDKKHKKDVSVFALNLFENLKVLEKELQEKTYKHGIYEHFIVNDPKKRDIHKASVKDRIVHHLLVKELYPYFDKKFIHDSYSCRVNKGTHKAIFRFESFSRKVSKNNTKTCWVLKCDIKKFFANIDHNILKEILAKQIQDKDTLNLLENIIGSFSARKDLAENGLPLGNLTSQLLVNVYMNEFDQYVKHILKVKYYIRYADDFVILDINKIELENFLSQISEFLKNNLKLTLHPDKVFIKTLASGVDFLGWVHFPYHRVLRTSTKRRMFRNLQTNQKLNTIASYLGMLSHGDSYELSKQLLSLDLFAHFDRID